MQLNLGGRGAHISKENEKEKNLVLVLLQGRSAHISVADIDSLSIWPRACARESLDAVWCRV